MPVRYRKFYDTQENVSVMNSFVYGYGLPSVAIFEVIYRTWITSKAEFAIFNDKSKSLHYTAHISILNRKAFKSHWNKPTYTRKSLPILIWHYSWATVTVARMVRGSSQLFVL